MRFKMSSGPRAQLLVRARVRSQRLLNSTRFRVIFFGEYCGFTLDELLAGFDVGTGSRCQPTTLASIALQAP